MERRYLNAKLCTEDMAKMKIGNDSKHEISDDSGMKVEKCSVPRNLRLNSTSSACHSFHKCTWTSSDWKTHNHIDHISTDVRQGLLN